MLKAMVTAPKTMGHPAARVAYEAATSTYEGMQMLSSDHRGIPDQEDPRPRPRHCRQGASSGAKGKHTRFTDHTLAVRRKSGTGPVLKAMVTAPKTMGHPAASAAYAAAAISYEARLPLSSDHRVHPGQEDSRRLPGGIRQGAPSSARAKHRRPTHHKRAERRGSGAGPVLKAMVTAPKAMGHPAASAANEAATKTCEDMQPFSSDHRGTPHKEDPRLRPRHSRQGAPSSAKGKRARPTIHKFAELRKDGAGPVLKAMVTAPKTMGHPAATANGEAETIIYGELQLFSRELRAIRSQEDSRRLPRHIRLGAASSAMRQHEGLTYRESAEGIICGTTASRRARAAAAAIAFRPTKRRKRPLGTTRPRLFPLERTVGCLPRSARRGGQGCGGSLRRTMMAMEDPLLRVD